MGITGVGRIRTALLGIMGVFLIGAGHRLPLRPAADPGCGTGGAGTAGGTPASHMEAARTRFMTGITLRAVAAGRKFALLGAAIAVVGLSLLGGAGVANAALGTQPGTLQLNPGNTPATVGQSFPLTTLPTWGTTISCPSGVAATARLVLVNPDGITLTAMSVIIDPASSPLSNEPVIPGTSVGNFQAIAGYSPGQTGELAVECYSGLNGSGTAVLYNDAWITFNADNTTYSVSNSPPAGPVTPRVVLDVQPDPVQVSTLVTLTATVTAIVPPAATAAPVTTGTVQFETGSTTSPSLIGSPAALSASGVATTTTTFTSASPALPVVAVYHSADTATIANATSNTVDENVTVFNPSQGTALGTQPGTLQLNPGNTPATLGQKFPLTTVPTWGTTIACPLGAAGSARLVLVGPDGVTLTAFSGNVQPASTPLGIEGTPGTSVGDLESAAGYRAGQTGELVVECFPSLGGTGTAVPYNDAWIIFNADNTTYSVSNSPPPVPPPSPATELITVTAPPTGAFTFTSPANATVPLTVSGSTATGTLVPLTVSDTRNTYPGWSVLGQATDFTNPTSTPAGTITAANFNWTPTTTTPGDFTLGPASTTGLGTAQALASAAAGHGNSGTSAFSLGASLSLAIPASAPAGGYSSTLTLTANPTAP
jgi:hypothetical protein